MNDYHHILHTHISAVLTTEAVIAEHKLTIYPKYLPLTVMLTRLIAETKLKLPHQKSTHDPIEDAKPESRTRVMNRMMLSTTQKNTP